MSDLERAMALIINTFDKYAGKDKDKHTLSKSELKDLLQNELQALLGKASDKAQIDRIFKDLDINKDESVDFKEFGSMVFSLTAMCHDHFSKK